MKLKALSVKQPWANMIARGEKTMETRTYPTRYRGRFLIVSSKIPDIAPAGQALCVANLYYCRRMKKSDEQYTLCDLYDDAYVWILKDIKQIVPFPVRGQLGFYDVDVPVLNFIESGIVEQDQPLNLF